MRLLIFMFCSCFLVNANALNACRYLFLNETEQVQFDKTVQMIEKRKSNIFYGFEDGAFDGYAFIANLREGGVLDITARLDFPEFGERYVIAGKDLYRDMIKHFGFTQIKVIKGMWVDGTNHDQFFAALNAGFSHEEAARQTWSGKQAALYGFTKIESLSITNNAYTKEVVVYFVKP